jgi:outer membrane biosynthesis protein TonB
VFEDSFTHPKEAGLKRRDKLAVLGLVLIAHAILVYAVFHARFPIKMLNLKKEARNVRIVPPLKTVLPKIVGGAGGGQAPAKEAAPARTAEEAGGRRSSGPPPGAPAVAPPPAKPSGQAPPSGAVASLAAKFEKAMTSRSQSGGESGLKIILGPPGSEAAAASGTGKGPPPDLYQYIPAPAGSGAGAYGTASAGAGRGRGGRQRASVSIPLKGYDITPWAAKVIALVQRNWILPDVGRLAARTRVKIVLIIRRNGELASLEVSESSSLDVLDDAAVKALRASLPFPALPDDFPGDLLEADFEFAYED